MSCSFFFFYLILQDLGITWEWTALKLFRQDFVERQGGYGSLRDLTSLKFQS